MRVRFGDMVASLTVLLSQEPLEVLSREGNDLCFGGGVLFNDSFRIVLEDVGQLIRDDYLFSAINSLFPHVSHWVKNQILNLYNFIRTLPK